MAINHLWDSYGSIAPISVYSMRKRIGAYVGPLIRIRDDFDDSEQDVGIGADGWLAPFVTTGDPFVTVFYDQMGNDNLTNPALATQPLLLPSGSLNGRPILDCYDGNKFLVGSTFVSPSAHPHDIARPTWFGSYEKNISQNVNQLVMAIPSQLTGTPVILYGVGRTGTNVYSRPNGVTQTWGSPNTPFVTNNFIIDMQENPTNMRVYENSNVIAGDFVASDIAPIAATAVHVGRIDATATLKGYNRISELVITNQAILAADKTDVIDTLYNSYTVNTLSGNYKTGFVTDAGSATSVSIQSAKAAVNLGGDANAVSLIKSSTVAQLGNGLNIVTVGTIAQSSRELGFVSVNAVATFVASPVTPSVILTVVT